MKIKLNIKAISIAEKLLNKPFGKFDLSDEETLITLIYAMVSENNEETFTLNSFKKVLGQKKMGRQIFKMYTDEMEYIAQFGKPSEETGESDLYIGDLGAFLIASGMSEEFVLYKMKLFEIGDYIKAIDARKKEEMESDRFWTYLTILPHVDGKKLKSPQKLIEFPWEEEEKAKKRESELEQGEKIFERFMKSKKIKI